MTKPLGLVLMLLISGTVALTAAPSSADQDRARIVREEEQRFFEQATTLRRSIKQGWSPGEVLSIMGPADVVGRAVDGRDEVETWWYHGYEVGIQFRNGAVSTWFFRFMLR